MLSAQENYCPNQVTFPRAEPSHPTTVEAVKDKVKAFKRRIKEI
jgi:hypothetical protein